MSMSRRKFLGTTATAAVVAGTMTKGKVFGANERIRVACVGIRGRGGSHIEAFANHPESEVVAVCDVDSRFLNQRAEALEKSTGKKPRTAKDVRDLLARDDIDAITIATPNNSHTLIAVWACQAGKDVYVEKPLSHDVWEGRQLVAAAKKYGRVVQHGTQNRSSNNWLNVIKLLREGVIGEVHTARGLGYKNGNRGSIGFADDTDPPDYLDWNLWQGPALERPYNPLYHPYNWHWFWHYGNGEIGNQGVHQMDCGVWGMGKGLPVKVYSTGGRYTYKDQAETPNTNTACFTYADGTEFIFDVRNRFTNSEGGVMINGEFREGARVGNLFYGSEGYWVERVGFFDKDDNPMEVQMEDFPTEGPFGNFIKAVKSRKDEDNFASAEVGHESSVHCHLANISYRLGRSLEFNPDTLSFVNDDEANGMIRREYREGFEVPELA